MKRRLCKVQTLDKVVTMDPVEFVDYVRQKRAIAPCWYYDCVYRYMRADSTYVYIFFLDEFNFNSEII